MSVPCSYSLSELLKGIKGASAREANKLLGTSGQFWLDESFDHIVRSEPQYQRFLRYISDNPVRAHLPPDEYWLYHSPSVKQAFLTVQSSKTQAGMPVSPWGSGSSST